MSYIRLSVPRLASSTLTLNNIMRVILLTERQLSPKTKLTRQYLPESTPGLKRCNLSCNQPPSKSNKMSKLISPIYRKLTLILIALMNGLGTANLVRKLISQWRVRHCSGELALLMPARVRSTRELALTIMMSQNLKT